MNENRLTAHRPMACMIKETGNKRNEYSRYAALLDNLVYRMRKQLQLSPLSAIRFGRFPENVH
jgi:hypothetical protein